MNIWSYLQWSPVISLDFYFISGTGRLAKAKRNRVFFRKIRLERTLRAWSRLQQFDFAALAGNIVIL